MMCTLYTFVWYSLLFHTPVFIFISVQIGTNSIELYVCTYSIVLCLKYIIGFTDLLISCHVRNNNYELCKVWIFGNKITSR